MAKLSCPNCHCPLTPGSSQTQIICPRCASLLELEARCNGVCLSCHQGKKPENADICGDSADAVPIELTRSPQSEGKAQFDSKNKERRRGLKALLKRVFHV